MNEYDYSSFARYEKVNEACITIEKLKDLKKNIDSVIEMIERYIDAV